MRLPEAMKGRGFRSQKRMSPFLPNPNQTAINKNIKIAELSRETHLVQMTTQASFLADQENNKHFQPRMRLNERLNTKGITAEATQELIKN
jgi:hypothetical protein